MSSPHAASLRVLLALALPMVLSRATQSVMTFADALMVEHLGPQAIAASATGGFNVFLFMILPMGTVFIVQSFVAQLVGANDRDATPRYAHYGLIIALAAGILALVAIPAIDPLLAYAEFSPTVRNQMSEYMTIRMYSVAAVVGIEVLGNWYGGLGNVDADGRGPDLDGRQHLRELGVDRRQPRCTCTRRRWRPASSSCSNCRSRTASTCASCVR